MLNVEFNPSDIASPKRSQFGDRRVIADWYGYYAGYSVEFVRDVISVLQPNQDGLIVDPWNGAGTTTSTASLLGYRAFGNDINPVMRVISTARSAYGVDADSLIKRVRQDLLRNDVTHPTNLPWFSDATNAEISRLKSLAVKSHQLPTERLNEEYSLVLTALFGTLRKLVAPLQGSNPTWWKDSYETKLEPKAVELQELFLASLETLLNSLDSVSLQVKRDPVAPIIQCGDAVALPLGAESTTVIITSPPYLTRLDYAKSMSIELALLLDGDESFGVLRKQMMGSVLGGDLPDYQPSWGLEARSALDHAIVAAEQRKRSDGKYYAGTFKRYFRDLHRSLTEMDRILEKGGSAAIVVQGSRHRGRIIDLPLVVQEMGQELGWLPIRAVAWPTRDLGRINPRSSQYGHQIVSETAVLLKKP